MALVVGPVTVKNALAVPPLAVGSMPVTPEVSGKPVAFVRVPDDGVPSAGVTRVGDVAKTNAPLPVSSEITPANWLLVVAANCESGFEVSASPLPEGVAHVPSPRQKVDPLALVPLLRFVTGRLPVMSVAKSIAPRVIVCPEMVM